LDNTALSLVSPAGADSARRQDTRGPLELVVFAMSVDTLRHYAKWAQRPHPHEAVVVDACLLYQRPQHRGAILSRLAEEGFDRGRIHILYDDGVRNPDTYVDRFDGGIGADGAYAVPGLGDKHLYVFDDLSVMDGRRPVEAKLHSLMRLMAGIPRQSGMAVLFEGGQDRVCFSRHCIRTLDAKQRDVLIREALEDLRYTEQD